MDMWFKTTPDRGLMKIGYQDKEEMQADREFADDEFLLGQRVADEYAWQRFMSERSERF